MRSRTPHPHPTHPLSSGVKELSEMSNEEQDTPPHPPTLHHQELRVKWDEQWGVGHPTPTPPTLGHQELRLKSDELVHIMNKNIILQCRHTETPGVRLVRKQQSTNIHIIFVTFTYAFLLLICIKYKEIKQHLQSSSNLGFLFQKPGFDVILTWWHSW